MAEKPDFTRREIRDQLKPKFDEAVRRGSYEDFMYLITSVLGVERGSEECHFLESSFWVAVAERRRNKQQGL